VLPCLPFRPSTLFGSRVATPYFFKTICHSHLATREALDYLEDKTFQIVRLRNS
jgi:hypothetical protein